MSLIKNSKELKNASLLVILGPTASGKTDISLRLAKELEGEIISADSLQIYKEFDIGSAKPDERQLKTVKHHLIGTISPKTELNAFDYSTMARQSIKEVVSKGRFPILVGGSGLYVRAVLDGLLKVEGSFKGVRHRACCASLRRGKRRTHSRQRSYRQRGAQPGQTCHRARRPLLVGHLHRRGLPESLAVLVLEFKRP